MSSHRFTSTVRPMLLLTLAAGPCCIINNNQVGEPSGDGTTTTAPASTTDDEPPSPSTSSTPEGSSSGTPDPADTGDGTASGSTGGSESDASTGEPADPEPPKPDDLVVYITGNPADADVDPTGPGLVLMGGGPDVDEAFSWWGDYIAGGDVVVIRTSGSDGYNDYLFGFGNADSVETMLVTGDFASDPYVSWKLRHAEAIWMTGGDQATYLEGWKDTPLEDAVHEAWARGAVIGGTSAGLAVLGEFVYAAYNDGVYSYEALEDPYNFYMTMEQGFLALPMMEGIITDTHFGERDRMGRLVGFLARIHADGWATAATGIGVDEDTAVLVGPDGQGTVVGAGHVYVVRADDPPAVCMAGVELEYAGLTLHGLSAGDTLTFPGAVVAGPGTPLSAAGGVTTPADPYQ